VLAEIVDRGVVLDVCPTSNLRLGRVPCLATHPLPTLRAAGALCTLNTDDPAMFGTDLGREYEIAAELGVSAEDAYLARGCRRIVRRPGARRVDQSHRAAAATASAASG
jgi:aminodeoxyfutalosine deaminase